MQHQRGHDPYLHDPADAAPPDQDVTLFPTFRTPIWHFWELVTLAGNVLHTQEAASLKTRKTSKGSCGIRDMTEPEPIISLLKPYPADMLEALPASQDVIRAVWANEPACRVNNVLQPMDQFAQLVIFAPSDVRAHLP